METRIYKIVEYVYLFMAVFSVYLVYSNWNIDRNHAYIFIIFAVAAIFMFFFKRNVRQKIEQQNTKQ